MWDDLIEHQASFVRAGTATGLSGMSPETVDHERVLRALASESRLARRELASHFRFALSQSTPGKKFARMILSGDKLDRVYVFLTVPRLPEQAYKTYREMRSAALLAYCVGVKARFPDVTEAIGIASEPFSEKVSSQEFVYVDLTQEANPEEATMWKEAMEELDVLQTPTKDLRFFDGRSHEFPMPFTFGGSKFHEYKTGMPMNRARRRRMAREAKKKAKRAQKRKH